MTAIDLNEQLIEKLRKTAQSRGVSVESMLDDLLDAETTPVELNIPAINLSMYDSLFDGVLAVDNNANIVYWNTSAERIFGYPVEDIIGQPLELIIPDNSRERHRKFVRTFTGAVFGRSMTNRIVHGKHRNGKKFFIDVTISPIKYNEQSLTVAIFRDVNRRETNLQEDIERSHLLQMITESINELICVFDKDGLLTYVSPMIEFICGNTVSEAIGTDGYNHIHPDDIDKVKQFFADHYTDRQPHTMKFRSLRKDGVVLWVERTLTHVFDSQGNIDHSIAITRDVTRQHNAEQALQEERDLLASIMAASPAGINAVDPQGKIIFANKRSEEILGVPQPEITERTYNAPEWQHTDYDGNPYPDEKQPFVQVMKTKQPVWDVRHAIKWSTGETVYLSINGMPILDENGEVDKIVFAIEDYTTRKLQQDELEIALKEAQYLSEVRAQFISMVNHEFRTPLQIINSSVDLLKMKRDLMSEKEFLIRTGRIQQQIHILDEMLRDVAFINKYDRAGYDVKPEALLLSEFFTNLAEELSTIFPEHMPISMLNRGTDEITCDMMLMHHIFSNLLGNALKYSSPLKHVRCIVENRGHELYVEIRDQGRGIPEKDQANIFEEFRRGGNIGELQGSGLGLAITQRSVKRLNGHVSFESQEGVGTTFYVTIPLKFEHSENGNSPAALSG